MLHADGIKGGFLEYKGRPLVRKGDDIYYGDLSDKYYVHLTILSDKEVEGKGLIADKIMIQIFAKDAKMPEKQTVAGDLYDALDTADAWLTRYNR